MAKRKGKKQVTDPASDPARRTSRRGGRPRTRATHIPKLPILENGLIPSPQPMEDPPLSMDNVDRYKRSDCKYYSRCLDHAAKSGWNQFHCQSCKAFELDPEADAAYLTLLARMQKSDAP